MIEYKEIRERIQTELVDGGDVSDYLDTLSDVAEAIILREVESFQDSLKRIKDASYWGVKYDGLNIEQFCELVHDECARHGI